MGQLKAIRKGLYNSPFFARYWLGIDINPFQERVLTRFDECLWGGKYQPFDLIEMILHAGNRTGKTVLLAIIHIKFAYYKIGITAGSGYEEFKYRTFDISPQSRQAKECLKYIEDILVGRFTWQKDNKRFSNSDTLKLRNFYEGKNENLGELRYTNRSVTYAFSTGEDMGAGFQGLPAGIVTYDECVLSHHLEEELDSNVYSRLGDYGKLMMLIATPNEEAKSQQYFFHLTQEAERGLNNFIVIGGSYSENVFIPEGKRESHAKTVIDRNPEIAKQILHGAFVSTGGNMFESAVVERLWNAKRKPSEPFRDHSYMISVDFGVSDKGDETVMLVWDYTDLPVEIVYAYAKRGGDPYELMAVLRNLKISYNEAEVVIDTGGMGGVMFKKLLRDIKPDAFDASGGEEKDRALFYTQAFLTKNRKKVVENGELVERNPNFGWIRSFYLPDLATQMSTYRLDDKKLKQDWVSAFYMGCWWLWPKFGDAGQRTRSVRISPFRQRLPNNVRRVTQRQIPL